MAALPCSVCGNYGCTCGLTPEQVLGQLSPEWRAHVDKVMAEYIAKIDASTARSARTSL